MSVRTLKRVFSAPLPGSNLLLTLAVVAGCTAAVFPQGKKQPVWVLPIEFDFDSGAENGDAVIARFVPVNSLVVGDGWRLVNIALLGLADAPGGRPGGPGNPEPAPGPGVFGFMDITNGLFYTRTTKSGFLWGVGGALGLPTATDARLGSGKWQLAPGVRLAYQAGAWRFGLLALNFRSFAGDSQRADVHQFLARGFIRRSIGQSWYFVSAPIVTANWEAASGDKWLVPLGGGVGREFRKLPVNLSLQFYGNVIKPEGAPNWVVRIGVTFPLDVPGFRP